MDSKTLNMDFMNKLFVIITFLLFVSCHNKNIERNYYDTGELYSETEIVESDSALNYKCKFYFKNGELKAEGLLVKDSLPDGLWKEYFDDGELKSKSFFSEGQPIMYNENGHFPELANREAYLRFKNLSKYTKEYCWRIKKYGSDTMPFRTFVEDTDNYWYNVSVTSTSNTAKIENNIEFADSYPYSLIVFNKPDTIVISYDFMNEDGMIIKNSNNTSFQIVVE